MLISALFTNHSPACAPCCVFFNYQLWLAMAYICAESHAACSLVIASTGHEQAGGGHRSSPPPTARSVRSRCSIRRGCCCKSPHSPHSCHSRRRLCATARRYRTRSPAFRHERVLLGAADVSSISGIGHSHHQNNPLEAVVWVAQNDQL